MAFSIGIGPNIRKSPYFDATVRDGVAAFSVYNHMYIPAHFGEPEAEYDRLISGVAMWDVAAQRQVEVTGPDAARLVQYLTPRDLSAMTPGQGYYVPLCDDQGWLINDPVLLKFAEDRFWLSVADSDIHLWATALAHGRGQDVIIREPDVSPLAIQGPLAVDVAARLFGDQVRDMRRFAFVETDLEGIPLVLARSGWSGQGGFELYLTDGSRGGDLWEKVKEAGAPFGIGPGAPNDTERLESGLISYGADARWQDCRADLFEMGFGRFFDAAAGYDYVGKAALTQMSASPPQRRLTGVVIEGRPQFPGHPLAVYSGALTAGWVSEFLWSPRLAQTIGIGVIRSDAFEADQMPVIRVGAQVFGVTKATLPFL